MHFVFANKQKSLIMLFRHKISPDMIRTDLLSKLNVLTVVLVALFIVGCEDTPVYPIDEDQKIIFHYSYENYAWGHQFQGWFIDQDGLIWDLNESLHWRNEAMNIITGGDEIYWINKEHIEDQYNLARGKLLGKIRSEEFDREIELIEEIYEEQYSDPEKTMDDAGSVIYGFLSLDEETSRYRKVILKGSGDWSYALADTNAVVLSNWLRSIQNKIGYTDYDN